MNFTQQSWWDYIVERCEADPRGRGRIRMHPEMRTAVLAMKAQIDGLRADAARWQREAMAERAAFAEYRRRWPVPVPDEEASPDDAFPYSTVEPSAEGSHTGVTVEGEESGSPRNL